MIKYAAVLWHEPTGKVIETVICDSREHDSAVHERWEALGDEYDYQWYDLCPAFRRAPLPDNNWYRLVKYIEKHGGWKKDINIWLWLDEAFIGRA